MANQPWKTDDWFVSEWNYAPEVTKDFKFAKNIKIHDVTLRDGEQQTGVILSKDEKIRIAEALAEAGVHRIEAGMPIVSPGPQAFLRTSRGRGGTELDRQPSSQLHHRSELSGRR